MNELSVLLKKEKAVQLAMRIIAVFTFVVGFVMIAILENAVIGMLVILVGFIIMTILAFRGQRIQKQAKATYQNGFLKNALAGILPRYDYIEKMENPDVNCFYQYGLLSKFNHVRVSEMLQVQYPEGSLSSMNVHFFWYITVMKRISKGAGKSIGDVFLCLQPKRISLERPILPTSRIDMYQKIRIDFHFPSIIRS